MRTGMPLWCLNSTVHQPKIPQPTNYLATILMFPRAERGPQDSNNRRIGPATFQLLDGLCSGFGLLLLKSPSPKFKRRKFSATNFPQETDVWLVVQCAHLEKHESQWEGLSHIVWKIKNVWNHQPDVKFRRNPHWQTQFVATFSNWFFVRDLHGIESTPDPMSCMMQLSGRNFW